MEMESIARKDWYRQLKRSSLTPPDWVFGVVWPILYIMIIASGFLYITTVDFVSWRARVGITLYILQWIVNLSWSPLFFQQRRICASFVVVLVMVLLVGATIWEFHKKSPMAAYLLVPYFLWISFASYLNGYICVSN
jgi:translocator protein